MKSTLLLLILVFSGGISACESTRKAGEQAPSQTVTEETTANAIVRDTVTNSRGDKLLMAYGNVNRVATFVLNGEVIQLKQDSVASGIRYSNTKYEYTEHQGAMTLRKGDNVVFSNK